MLNAVKSMLADVSIVSPSSEQREDFNDLNWCADAAMHFPLILAAYKKILTSCFLSVFAGGIGEAVCGAVSEEAGIIVRRLAVPRIPRSGPPDVLVDMFGISARHIIAAAKSF